MFSTQIFVLLACFILQYTVSAEKKAYVKRKNPAVECTAIPDEGICPSDHKIPDLSKIVDDDGKPLPSVYNATVLNLTLSVMKQMNETCKNSYRDYICAFSLPDCKDNDDFYTYNGAKVPESCMNVKKHCPSVYTSFINCNVTAKQQPKRMLMCKAYPDIKDDPYPCSKRIGLEGPYIPSAGNASLERGAEVLSIHNDLKKSAGKLDKKCVNNVAQMICDAAPACSQDKNFIVDLVNKQECLTVMKCLEAAKNANLTKRTMEVCNRLADKTAATISLSDVYTTGGGATQGASSIIMFISLLYFIQHLCYL